MNWYLHWPDTPWPEGLLPPPPTFITCAKAPWILEVSDLLVHAANGCWWNVPCSEVLSNCSELPVPELKEGVQKQLGEKNQSGTVQQQPLKEPIKTAGLLNHHTGWGKGLPDWSPASKKPDRKLKVGTADLEDGSEAPIQIIRTQISGFEKSFLFFFSKKMVKTTKAFFAVFFSYLCRFPLFCVFNWTWQWLVLCSRKPNVYLFW